MDTPCISILLGSGFSVSEGLPTVTDINKKLANLKEDDFYIYSDQSAGFYASDYRDPNAWSSIVDRRFAENFTSFYKETVLNGDTSNFNYEVFYDYIVEYLQFKKNKEPIENLCTEFRQQYDYPSFPTGDAYNLVWRFSKIFNQLVASLLFISRFYEDVSYTNYPRYGGFFGFLRENLKSKVVNVHTLNHDIFFDHLASKHVDLWQHFTDGFSDKGSPYYGEVGVVFKVADEIVHKNYKVRLKYYTGHYDNKLKLFKLHGSIDNCLLHDTSKEDRIRVKRDFGVKDFLLERFDEQAKKYVYEMPFTENEPDYLTGTTDKLRQYHQPFYENLFLHFKNNLLKSNQLLVLGYGFQDKGINEMIENHFLIYNKTMIVVDVRQPQSYLFDKYKEQITLSLDGATGLSYDDFMLWKT